MAADAGSISAPFLRARPPARPEGESVDASPFFLEILGDRSGRALSSPLIAKEITTRQPCLHGSNQIKSTIEIRWEFGAAVVSFPREFPAGRFSGFSWGFRWIFVAISFRWVEKKGGKFGQGRVRVASRSRPWPSPAPYPPIPPRPAPPPLNPSRKKRQNKSPDSTAKKYTHPPTRSISRGGGGGGGGREGGWRF